MNSFYAIEPSPVLAPFVKQYWFVSLDNITEGYQRLLPFGYVGLTFHRTTHNNLFDGNTLAASYISGQSTRYGKLFFNHKIDFISIVFQPIGAMLFLNIPMCEFSDKHISIDNLEDKSIIELRNRLIEESDNRKCIESIEKFLIKRLDANQDREYNRLATAIKSIHNGVCDIPLLAQTACLGYKQFKRIFYNQVGINPKDYIRIKRFQQVSHIMQYNCVTLDELADNSKYYDKSHLIKDFKEFSGHTPKEYLAHCDPYSGYHALFRSAFLNSSNE